MGSLPKALSSAGNDVDVFIPFHLEAANWYRARHAWPEEALPPFDVSILGRPYRVGLLWDLLPGTTVPIYFVAHDPLFHRGAIYAPNEKGQDDGLWRFSIFVRAAVEAGAEAAAKIGELRAAHVIPRPDAAVVRAFLGG